MLVFLGCMEENCTYSESGCTHMVFSNMSGPGCSKYALISLAYCLYVAFWLVRFSPPVKLKQKSKKQESLSGFASAHEHSAGLLVLSMAISNRPKEAVRRGRGH